MHVLVLLFLEFFKVGLFSVGGGLATIPFLYDLTAKYDWYTSADVADMIAISESTPGPIGVNMATYAGYQTYGVFGGAVATLGLIAPAIIIIFIVAKILKAFKQNKYVQSAFYGLRPASIGLIGAAVWGVAEIALFNVEGFLYTGKISDFFIIKGIILAVCLFIIQKIFKKIHPVCLIAVAAAAGIIFGM